ncbi:MAG TPA: fibronectin type III domain-containing protein [Candidatus Thermoplasmatota archaeon]|nr:fibronectin type III domain-containing protein [Candidatus Thermoplasmatota archaeon]
MCTRFALLVALATLPLAAAQSLPVDPTAPTAPPLDIPATPVLPGDMDIHEQGLTFVGPAAAPTHVRVDGPDGAPAFEYAVDDEGRARIDLAGQNALADATLLAVRGDPVGDWFAIRVQDPQGDPQEFQIDRAGMLSNVNVPIDEQLPVVSVVRPPAWPGAPAAPYLLFVEDDAPNHLAPAKLDGSRFLQRGGVHRAVLQIPLSEATYDRMFLEVRAGDELLTATFAPLRETDTAASFETLFRPSDARATDGASITIQPVYERRLSPLVVERFNESMAYSYRVDGTGPSVTIDAPASADDFSFVVQWNGADALSGLGAFHVDYREAGGSAWTRWIAKSPAKSATFSGEWGHTYEFRATALDEVGNPSTPGTATTAIAARPGGSPTDDINHPPTARLLTPRAGSLVAGLASVTWSAADPDGTPVTSKVELSADDGDTWRVLYSGPGQSAEWDSRSDADGPGYRLRLTVSDGTQQASDATGALTVRNVASKVTAPADAPGAPTSAPPAPPVPSPGDAAPDASALPDEAPGDASADAKKVPAPFVGLAIAGAALLARRKRA